MLIQPTSDDHRSSSKQIEQAQAQRRAQVGQRSQQCRRETVAHPLFPPPQAAPGLTIRTEPNSDVYLAYLTIALIIILARAL